MGYGGDVVGLEHALEDLSGHLRCQRVGRHHCKLQSFHEAEAGIIFDTGERQDHPVWACQRFNVPASGSTMLRHVRLFHRARL